MVLEWDDVADSSTNSRCAYVDPNETAGDDAKERAASIRAVDDPTRGGAPGQPPSTDAASSVHPRRPVSADTEDRAGLDAPNPRRASVDRAGVAYRAAARSVRTWRCVARRRRAIQELAGHQDLGTTQRYMHLSPAALDAAIRLLETGTETSRAAVEK